MSKPNNQHKLVYATKATKSLHLDFSDVLEENKTNPEIARVDEPSNSYQIAQQVSKRFSGPTERHPIPNFN